MSGHFNVPSSLERRGLPRVKLARYCCPDLIGLEHYRQWVSEALMDEINSLARDLRGVRVCHINSTSSGGGVAEMLSSLVPLCSTLGLTVDWRLIIGDDKFFNATKGFHNALQGARLTLSQEAKRIYLDHNRVSANETLDNYDLYVVHDPQPVAIRQFAGANHAKWIWRCHIDSSSPDPGVWQFLRPFVEQYDAVVFTIEAFQPSDLPRALIWFIPPAIDPLSTKNLELSEDLYCRVLSELGVSLRRPLLLQVSRFDPWKDPLGVVRAYRLVREELPDIQLALLGGMATDDPQGGEVLEALRLEAEGDRGIHIFTNLGNLEVNSFQQAAYAVIQKSTKEGFGLVVSEALWKRKPVVAGNVGGIPLQFPAGYEQFLVENEEQCAARLLTLLRQPAMAQEFGVRGREKVAAEFLLPRLLRDELRLFREVLGIQSKKIPTRSESEAVWGHGKQQLTGSISNEP
jgi:trehalose synthase